MVVFGVAFLAHAGSSMANISTNPVTSALNTLTVAGYTDTGTSGALVKATGTAANGCYSINSASCTPELVWYSGGSGYGLTSTQSDRSSPNHALDNNINKESLLINFGAASKQLDKVTIGWNGGYDTDITVLAWKPSDYMNPANPVVAAPVFGATTKYADLVGLGWSLVGNYANLAPSVAKSVNITNPVSSSYWLVMAYNSAFSAYTPSDRSETNATITPLDYGKFYSVSYSDGTKNRVPEPSTALLLGAALFGLIGQRSRRLKA